MVLGDIPDANDDDNNDEEEPPHQRIEAHICGYCLKTLRFPRPQGIAVARAL